MKVELLTPIVQQKKNTEAKCMCTSFNLFFVALVGIGQIQEGNTPGKNGQHQLQ